MDPKDILGKRQVRELTLTREGMDADARTVPLAFCSETPYERYWGVETLGCKPDEVRMDRIRNGAPLLLGHDPDRQIGVIESASLDPDCVGRCVVRFSKSALGEEIFRDVQDGIRKKVSVGYMVHSMQLEKKEGNTEFYRANDWEPLEVSIVSVAADDTVGVGRAAAVTAAATAEAVAGLAEAMRKDIDPRINPDANVGAAETISIKEVAMKDKDGNEILEPTPAEVERQRVEEIEAVGKAFGSRIKGGETAMAQLVKDAIALDYDAKLFKGDIYTRVNDDQPLEVPLTQIGLSKKEIEKYSIMRVVQSQITGSGVKADFERECSEEIAKKVGAPRGMHVPFEIQMRQYNTRVALVSAATNAGNLVGTDLLASSFIELLRHKTLAFQLGVRRLPGLVGDVAIPRQTAAGTFYWVAEATAPGAESGVLIDQVTMTPHTGGAYYDYSRKLMLQSTPGIEGIIMDDLVNICRIGVDLAVFHGTNANDQPRGIAGAASIGGVDGAAFGWAEAVEFETDVATADADAGSMAFVCPPSVRGLLKTREISTGYPKFICDENNRVNGYPLFVTNQISAANLLFGDFAQAMVGEWGGLDILVDPYTGSSTGNVRVRGFISIDVAVRHPGAFSLCDDVA